MSLIAIPALIAFLINFVISFNLIFSLPRTQQKLWLGLFILTFALWNLSQILIISLFSYPLLLTIGKILYGVLFLTPAFFVMVSFYYPQKIETQKFNFLLVFGPPILLIILFYPYVSLEIYQLKGLPNNYFFRIKINSIYYIILQLVVFISYTAWGAKIMFDKIKALKLVKLKSQTIIFLIGNLGIFSLLVIVNILKYNILSQGVIWYLAMTLLSLIISLFFLIISLEYKWLRLKIIISGGITYLFFSALIITINFLFLQYVINKITKTLNINSVTLNILFLFFIILIFTPLINYLRKKIDLIFFANEHSISKEFQKFINKISNVLEINTFLTSLESFITSLFRIDYIIILLNNNNDGYECINEKYDFFLPYNSYLEKYLISQGQLIEIYELNPNLLDKKTLLFFDFIDAWLIIPMIAENKLLSIIILPKIEKIKIRYGILEQLNYFFKELTVFLHRNLLIQKIREEEKQKQRLERLASLGKLTSGIAHELRNPLNTISVSAQTLKRKINANTQEQELLDFIIEETERLNDILTEFLNISKIPEIINEKINIQEIFAKLEKIVNTQNDKILLSLIVHFKPEEIISDKKLLYQAMLNIVLNAIDAIKEKCKKNNQFNCQDGKILIDFYKRLGKYYITIRNNGDTIKKEIIDKIFDPFFTTKETGTGLGLTITYNIIKSLGGEIFVKKANDFTIFEIVLPENIEQ